MVYGGAFFVFLQNSVCMAWALVYLHHFVSGGQPLRAEQSQSRAEVGHNRYNPIAAALFSAL